MASQKLNDVIELAFPAALSAETPPAASAIQSQVLALFDECGPGVRRYVASFRLDASVVDDVVQEVFLALFRHLSLGRPATNLKAWLFQVAHNLALKQRQRAMKRGRIEAAWDTAAAAQLADAALDPEARLVERQRQDRLTSALGAMSERDRRCVFLRAEGLAYRQIARTLGVSLGSVAKSVVRSVARLSAADQE